MTPQNNSSELAHDRAQPGSESAEIPKPRTAAELHQAALELMKKKHRDMGFIEDVIR